MDLPIQRESAMLVEREGVVVDVMRVVVCVDAAFLTGWRERQRDSC